MCTDVRKGTSWWVKIVRWVNRRSNQGWAEVFQRLESCVAPFSAENYKEDSTWPTKTAENYISSLHFLGFRLICCGQLSCMLRWWKRKGGRIVALCGDTFYEYMRQWDLNTNRSLDRYCAICYREYNFLPSFIFLLASCCSFVLDVALYAFELTTNHLSTI